MELKEFRTEHNLSQMKLAALLGVSLLTIQRWENGAGLPNEENREILKRFMEEKREEEK